MSAARESNRPALVVVAHPDDEVIWCGGFILQHPSWQWTVLSMCRRSDPDRRPKFHRVCKRFGARGVLLDLDDSAELKPIHLPRDIGGRLRRQVCDEHWHLVLTHGAEGEYGHLRHRQVHDEVVRLVDAGALATDELWTFAIRCSTTPGDCAVPEGVDVRIELTDGQLAEKTHLVRDVYGYAEESFEVRACLGVEGFWKAKRQNDQVKRQKRVARRLGMSGRVG